VKHNKQGALLLPRLEAFDNPTSPLAPPKNRGRNNEIVPQPSVKIVILTICFIEKGTHDENALSKKQSESHKTTFRYSDFAL
jgi:hypothetical protein